MGYKIEFGYDNGASLATNDEEACSPTDRESPKHIVTCAYLAHLLRLLLRTLTSRSVYKNDKPLVDGHGPTEVAAVDEFLTKYHEYKNGLDLSDLGNAMANAILRAHQREQGKGWIPCTVM